MAEETPITPPEAAETPPVGISEQQFQEELAKRDSKIEELAAKNESLSESLDSTLEELALRGRAPIADPEVPVIPSAPVLTPEKPKPEVGVPPVVSERGDDISREIERSIREEEDFREQILQKEELRDLQDELKEAKGKFPEASEDEILDEVDYDPTTDIMKVAEASHNKRLNDRTTLEKKIEEDVKERLLKEGAGGISVPQSPATIPAPSAPIAPGVPQSSRMSEDSDWGLALKKAKAEGVGA